MNAKIRASLLAAALALALLPGCGGKNAPISTNAHDAGSISAEALHKRLEDKKLTIEMLAKNQGVTITGRVSKIAALMGKNSETGQEEALRYTLTLSDLERPYASIRCRFHPSHKPYLDELKDGQIISVFGQVVKWAGDKEASLELCRIVEK